MPLTVGKRFNYRAPKMDYQQFLNDRAQNTGALDGGILAIPGRSPTLDPFSWRIIVSVNAAVFVGCMCLAFLWAGIEIGMDNPHKPAPRPVFRCPVVQGQEVVSSIDSPDGQFCVYANSFGRATYKIRVAP